ncbi:hypothetical protein, partial [Escherichia coli]|uniref:hypothetical protein n=1 Tax=Escherichia coli TaxID=562 RepID=UPI001A7E14E9
FIKSPVLCCGENITFHQVAKFSVPLQSPDNAYPAMIRYIYGTRLFSLCSFSDFIFRKCSPA